MRVPLLQGARIFFSKKSFLLYLILFDTTYYAICSLVVVIKKIILISKIKIMKRIINAINDLTRALYGVELTSNDVVAILDNGKANAIKLQAELERAIQEEDSIVN